MPTNNGLVFRNTKTNKTLPYDVARVVFSKCVNINGQRRRLFPKPEEAGRLLVQSHLL